MKGIGAERFEALKGELTAAPAAKAAAVGPLSQGCLPAGRSTRNIRPTLKAAGCRFACEIAGDTMTAAEASRTHLYGERQ